jgi:hypothetical protein
MRHKDANAGVAGGATVEYSTSQLQRIRWPSHLWTAILIASFGSRCDGQANRRA